MSLPFLRLIMSIMCHKKVQFPHGLLVMKREDQISTQTVIRSKAHLCVPREEEERAEGEDTAPEGGNIMKILTTSPSILKAWKPHLLSRSNSHKLSLMHLIMLLIVLTCFLINSIISNDHRKLCKGCWTNTMRTPPHR